MGNVLLLKLVVCNKLFKLNAFLDVAWLFL